MSSLLDAEFQKFAKALALTESGDKETAWGDDAGRGINYLAAGRWQMHPAFVWEWGPDSVPVLTSWNTVFEWTLKSFYALRKAKGRSVYQIAMEFHLGVEAVAQGRWASGYAQDFTKHYDELPVGSA